MGPTTPASSSKLRASRRSGKAATRNGARRMLSPTGSWSSPATRGPGAVGSSSSAPGGRGATHPESPNAGPSCANATGAASTHETVTASRHRFIVKPRGAKFEAIGRRIRILLGEDEEEGMGATADRWVLVEPSPPRYPTVLVTKPAWMAG